MSLLEIGNLDEVKAPIMIPKGTFKATITSADVLMKESGSKSLVITYTFDRNANGEVDGRDLAEYLALPRLEHFERMTQAGCTVADLMLGRVKERMVKLGVAWTGGGVEREKVTGKTCRVQVEHVPGRVKDAETGEYKEDPTRKFAVVVDAYA